MVTGLFRRLAWRSLVREPGRTFLAVLAVALGVSVFLAIRLANRAAVASFDAFTRGVGTGADLVVRAEIGPLDERELPRLEALRRDAWIRPVLEGSFSRAGDLEPFQVLGTDLVALGAANPDPGSTWGGLERILQDPDGVLAAPALGLAPGAHLAGWVDGREVDLHVAGLVPDLPGRPPAQRNLLVMDLPAAQRLFRRPGQLDRLDLGWLPGRDGARVQAQVRAALPRGWSTVDPELRAQSGRTMSAAFRLNLTVLSLVALAVGAYLLFQAFDAAVERRRETWALLQALGCPGGRVLALVLEEAALVGALGSLLGLLLGWAMAQGAVLGVARTMSALYGAASARAAAFQGREALLAFLGGTSHLRGRRRLPGPARRPHAAGAAHGPGRRSPAHALGTPGPGGPGPGRKRPGPGLPPGPAPGHRLARVTQDRPWCCSGAAWAPWPCSRPWGPQGGPPGCLGPCAWACAPWRAPPAGTASPPRPWRWPWA